MKLSDRFTAETGTVYLTGIQALVRLPLDQMRRDRRAGWKTAGFISGYEGSPLAGYDLALQRERALLDAHNVRFWPAVNEDLAATAVWGTQILETLGPNAYDGIVGMWYGKGPGVDRSGDALRHANFGGTGKRNAALVLAGDDPGSKSSTIPHQSEFSLYNIGIPILYPGNVQEVLDYGLLAIALSRHSGAWAALKLVTNVCDGGGTVNVDPGRVEIVWPQGYEKSLDPRLVPLVSLRMEPEVNVRRIAAAREFARLNAVNRISGARGPARLGIATAGKPYYDVCQALTDLGIRPDEAGVRIAKFGMTFPLVPEFVHEFAEGLDHIIVVEEKRSFLELQLREILYDRAQRPRITGGLKPYGELDPDVVAPVLATALGIQAGRLRTLEEVAARPRELAHFRMPNFCSGCPHNRSTLLLEGQMAGGGIGCHGMSMGLADVGRGYAFLTQMGGEGVPWIGMAPFTERKHIFQNIGDGTYFHSGSLALGACVAAGVNITYKILYNGHVAMTGGQEISGVLPVPELTRKLEAEGVRKTVVLAESVEKYAGAALAANAEVRDRSKLLETLKELEQIAGVTVLVYDQQCAAEKRRMRSRGKLAEPALRMVIHEEVCEGCLDCVRQSNCASLQPAGGKVRIHQSSCNKDYTCALGDCPSFLSVEIEPGSGLKRREAADLALVDVPPPRDAVRAGAGYRIVSPGIGGTGVVTINALLATAAMLDGLSVLTLDQTGLAQKGGAVVSHLLLSEGPVEAPAKTNAGNADLLLGFDLLGTAGDENLRCAHSDRSVAVVNSHLTPTAEAVRKGQAGGGANALIAKIEAATRRGRNVYIDASRRAEELFADHLAVNLFLLGAAYQAGLLPLRGESLEEAIRLNGVAVERNLKVFRWGRKEYLEPHPPVEQEQASVAEPDLEKYQNARYAEVHRDFVARMPEALRATVSRNLARLMAYKDEYEVARLLTDPAAERRTLEMWQRPLRLSYNLHPPLLRRLGWRNKIRLSSRWKPALRLLGWLRFLRGTPFDVFGMTAHRRRERALVGWYRDLMERAAGLLNEDNLETALALAALPEGIRGFESLKDQSMAEAQATAATLMERLRMPATSRP